MRAAPAIQILSCLTAIIAAGCTQAPFTAPRSIDSSFRLDAGVSELNPGQSVQLTAVLSDPGDRVLASDQVTWSSSDPAIADVLLGRVTAFRQGTVVISATYGADLAQRAIAVVGGPACTSAPSRVPQGCPPPVN